LKTLLVTFCSNIFLIVFIFADGTEIFGTVHCGSLSNYSFKISLAFLEVSLDGDEEEEKSRLIQQVFSLQNTLDGLFFLYRLLKSFKIIRFKAFIMLCIYVIIYKKQHGNSCHFFI